MTIAFSCPGCKTSFKVADKHAGITTKCRTCGAPIRVPLPGLPQDAVARVPHHLDPSPKLSLTLSAGMTRNEMAALRQALERVNQQIEKPDYSGLIVVGGILVSLIIALPFYTRGETAAVILGLSITLTGATGAILMGIVQHNKAQQHNKRLERVGLRFNLDEAHRARFAMLVEALDSAAKSGLRLGRGPKFVESDIDLRSTTHDCGMAYYLPDRALLYSRRSIIDLPYSSLSISMESETMSGSHVPHGAEIVSTVTTYRHMRVDGGPDRRYKDNPATITYQYRTGRLVLSSSDGLRMVLCAKNPRATDEIGRAIHVLCGRNW
jgi:hypothetical protein